MGSPLTEGNALFLDRDADWRGALQLLVAHVSELAESAGASLIVLRDLPADDPALDGALRELGFAELPAPDSFALEIDWRTRDEYLARLSRRARRFQREKVAAHEGSYRARVLRATDSFPESFWSHLHALYLQVWRQSFALNTFALPEDFLPRMLDHEGFEIVTLTRPGERLPDAFFAAWRSAEHYAALVLGLERRAVREHGVYRRCLATALERAERLGLGSLRLGMGAPLEKRRFGAKPVSRKVWFQARDHFHADVIALLAGDTLLRPQR